MTPLSYGRLGKSRRGQRSKGRNAMMITGQMSLTFRFMFRALSEMLRLSDGYNDRLKISSKMAAKAVRDFNKAKRSVWMMSGLFEVGIGTKTKPKS